jgi:glycosyltransferase involved in cell wall biosynthesis
VRNEAENIAPLVAEIAAALAGRSFEVIYVNDGSTDATEAELVRLKAQHPWLRQIRHARSCGQSAALRTGLWAARAPVIATLDGDGQNDPAFLPQLIAKLEQGAPRLGLVAGQRVGRKATAFKRFQSRFANVVRGAILRDGPGLAGGSSRPGTPIVPRPDPGAAGPPDPFALIELAIDVRPPDYASSFAHQATHLSELERPVLVCTVERPDWLRAVLEEPGVEAWGLDAALAQFARA